MKKSMMLLHGSLPCWIWAFDLRESDVVLRQVAPPFLSFKPFLSHLDWIHQPMGAGFSLCLQPSDSFRPSDVESKLNDSPDTGELSC